MKQKVKKDLMCRFVAYIWKWIYNIVTVKDEKSAKICEK